MTARASRRPLVSTIAGFAVALSALAVVSISPPAQADVSTKISTFPYTQDWSDAGLITTTDDWSLVQGVQGYLGGGLTSGSTTNPQTITADGGATATDVIANGASTSSSGGVLEAAAEQTIALQGSGSANAPHVVFHLDLTGQTGVTFSFDARDIDAQAGEATQQIAVQYRLGSDATYTDLPDGYISDASSGPSLATLVTHRDVVLPPGTDGQSDVYVRVMTADAGGSDEWIGIDNIAITPGVAETGGLVINEVYGAGGNSGASLNQDFVELRNTSSQPIALTGKSLQYRSAANRVAPTALNVSLLPARIVPPGETFLVAFGSASDPDGTALPTPDATGTLNMAAGAGQVFLAEGAAPVDPDGAGDTAIENPAVLDFVGFGASAVLFEGTGPTPAPSTVASVSRNAAGDDTDDNAADFAVTNPPTPVACTGCTDDVQPLQATTPGNQTVTLNTPITQITLAATGGTPGYTWDVTGLPLGVNGSSGGVIAGTPTETGVFNVSATVTDSASPTAGTATVQFTITVEGPPEELTIAEIQGTGPGTPKEGVTVITRGVVTASYPSGTGSMAGFVIQTGGEEGVDYDTPGASDAVFVFSGNKPQQTIGDSVEVKGVAGERFGTTQINASAAASTITAATEQPPVVPNDVIPGTDCAMPGTDCPTVAELDVMREEFEHEAFQPTGDYTVTDSYDGSPGASFGMQGEIGIAAERDLPLMIPTETIDQSDTAGLDAHRAYNAAHLLILDDAKSVNYATAATEDTPFPWFTADHPVRTGAPVTFPQPVILKYDFGSWRILPREEVAGGDDGQDLVAIENTRTNAPEEVLGATGDLKIATFNMLNYFNTFGEVYAESDGVTGGSPGSAYDFENPRRCSYYTDRGPVPPATGTAARITNNTCEQDAIDPLTGLKVKLPGPRGAANETSFLRQEVKLVKAINTIDADVMSLEEVENSIKLYDSAMAQQDPADANRDDALERLVSKLNEAAEDPNRWAFVASPRPQALPTVQEQDAIRNAFIYNPATVELVGPSQVLVNSPAMRNAREPLAQAFKPFGGGREDAFIVIVNHFKSKGGPQDPAPPATGDNADSGDGAGFYNGDRKRQAQALVAFANQVSSDKNIDPVFLTGDFNSYSAEDPVQVIEGGGFTNLKPSDGSTSYNFGGLAGSLDHVFANAAAESMVTGEDIWEINANEAVYYEYSRFNYNAAQLYDESVFRSSDHNPEIIGIDVGELTPDPLVDTVQILATNDFHGRLLDDPGSGAAGAASLAGAVKELRQQNDSTIFSAAGDLVGATTFESFIQNDQPTIDALNAAGLEVSSVGNHEFDQGFEDLVGRIMVEADWEYLGANVEFKDTEDGHQAGDPALPETWCETLPNGRVVGFVGAVTEDLPALVAGSGIEDIVVTDIVDAVNEHADDLKGPAGCGADGPADLVIELVHEGAATTAYASVTDNSAFGQIVAGANENVDAIVSGHTHLAYNHKVPVQAWIDDNRDVTERPVVSAGQYGSNLNRLQFEFAPGGDGDLVNVRQTLLQLKDYDPDPATQEIVDDAVEFAETAGNAVLGEIEDPFVRARRIGDDGQINENRGGESTLGNLIAEMQRWKTEADIGFMNPGGLRADLVGLVGDPRDVTYRQAANTQPFANTLVTMDLTGAQIKTLLEQQWQRDADDNIPSRPFLRLGTSEGFASTFDASQPEGQRITGMWLDGVAINPTTVYKVSATSFLAGAGDNFKEFANGTNVQDTGKTDLQAVVDYLEANAPNGGATPLPVDYAQRQVGIAFPGGAPAEYEAGDTLTFSASSLAMTGVDDLQDTQVQLYLGDDPVGTPAPVSNTLTSDPTDAMGTATVSVTVPPGVSDGTTVFRLVGNNTGTEVKVPVPTSDGLVNSTVSGANQTIVIGDAGSVPVTVTPATATGTVTLKDGAVPIGTLTLDGVTGTGNLAVPANSLPVGVHTLTLDYSGDDTNGSATSTLTVTVTGATPTINATPTPASVVVNGATSDIAVTVTSATSGDATGTVTASVDGNVVDTETLSGGAATLTVGPFNTAGDKTITIAYSGDATTDAGTTTTTVAVTKAAATVAATPSPASVPVNGGTSDIEVFVTSAADGDATGTVTASVNGGVVDTETLAGGAATLTVGPFATLGDKTVTIAYSGDASTDSGSTTATIGVVQATPTVTAMPNPASVVVNGGSSTIAVTVSASGSTPTGTVTASVNGTIVDTATLASGAADLSVGPFSTVGPTVVTIDYSGDVSHTSASTTTTVTVTQPAPTATTTSATVGAMTYGSPGTVNASVSPAGATGTVTVSSGSTILGTGTLDGAGNAQITLPAFSLEPGNHSLTVTYGGDATHAASSTTVTIVVSKAMSTTAAFANPTQVTVNRGTSAITVVVGSSGGTPTGTVQAYVDGNLVGSGLLAAGRATLTVGPFATIGTARVEIRYLGDAHVAASQDTVNIRVDRAAKVVPRMGVAHTPNVVRAQRTRAILVVGVAAGGDPASGLVKIRIPGTVNGVVIKTVRLQGGRADVRLPRFQVRGTKRIRVTYLGNATTAKKVAFHTIRVSPRKR